MIDIKRPLKTSRPGNRPIPCRLHCVKINRKLELASLSQVVSKLKHPSILGANTARKNSERFSYFAAEPAEIFRFHAGCEKPFEKLHKILNKYKLKTNCQRHLPEKMFHGGWVGYFSYELARYIEKLPQTTNDQLDIPLIRLCFYDKVICYDHKEGNFRLLILQTENEKQTVAAKLDFLSVLLDAAANEKVTTPAAELENIDMSRLNCNMSKDYYLKTVEKIKQYIRNGDIYQVNFSRRFQAEFDANPIDLFHWQSRYNPSDYAAYIKADNFAVVSASPEMFITVHDRLIKTKPIKGTRPRLCRPGPADKTNAENYSELLNSEKEKAELNMITDLERNDIARLCSPGTRKVTQTRTIETYPTVFHAASTIEGQLKKQVGFCDILKAMFPGGSITGAPKIRSMEIIDETEPTGRDVYTGSIGFIGLNSNVSLNIAIRTIIIKDGWAFVHTGGAIVADSAPQAEWDETITKAMALLAGINAVRKIKVKL